MKVFRDKTAHWLYWLVALLFLIWVDFDGLRTWFAADDFAWLSLLPQAQAGTSLAHLLFAPAAQGTIRPWSERGFFLLFEYLFGLHSLPFRIAVFATMALNLWLLIWLTARLTGSRLAGFFAAIIWAANSALAPILAWTSAYNEVLCACFLLSTLALFVKYIETGRPLFWWLQVVVFILGFGALEINVVYPAIAAAWAVFVAPTEKRRNLLVSLIPLTGISIAYFFVHRHFAPLPATGVYALRFDSRIFRTLGIFWKWSFMTPSWVEFGHSSRTGNIIFLVLVLSFAAFVVRQMMKHSLGVLFGLAWFLITIAPVLPIPEHRTDYYTATPVAGLAMAAGWAFAAAFGAGLWLRSLALIPLVLYLGEMVPTARGVSAWWLYRTDQCRILVQGVRAAHQAHPEKAIVLDGITGDLYDDAVGSSGFLPLGIGHVYLTEKTGQSIHPQTAVDRIPGYVLSGEAMRNAITHDQVVIYSFVGDHLRNVTEAWERANFSHLLAEEDSVPRRVDVANPLLAYLLGPEWLPVESDFRWMPQRATVRLGGPRNASDSLLLEGFCPAQQLSAGSLHLNVSVDGIALPGTRVEQTETVFRRLLQVPPSLVGRKAVEVAISVDRTFHDSAGRDLGLVFGTVAFVPESASAANPK